MYLASDHAATCSPTTRGPVSIVVPAHNESARIAGTLQSILRQTQADDEVIVVCNGCTDDTAAVVGSSFGTAVRLVEIDVASKVAALNRGDAEASCYPRLYVDGDVELSAGSIDALAAAVAADDIDLASPALDIDVSGATRPVQQYMRIWSRLPSVQSDTVGRGVYALSEAGRRTFGPFPNVMGDDHFVRDRIPPERRTVVSGVSSTVAASGNLRGLLRRKPRTVTGNRRLDTETVIARRRARARRRQWLGVVRRNPGLLPGVPVYVMVNVWARLVGTTRRLVGATSGWDRDDSTR